MPKPDSDTLYGSVCHADALMSMYCASQQLMQLLAQPLSLSNKLNNPQLLSRQLRTRTQGQYYVELCQWQHLVAAHDVM